jgi:hypothetical protein
MTEERILLLRARMIEDMRLRGVGEKAQTTTAQCWQSCRIMQ